MNIRHFKLLSFFALAVIGLVLIAQFDVYRHQYWVFSAAAIGLIGLYRNLQLKLVAVVSILFHLIPDPVSKVLYSTLQQKSGDLAGIPFELAHITMMTLCLTLVYVITRNLQTAKLDRRVTHFHFLLVCVIAFALGSWFYAQLGFIYPLYFLSLFARFVWPLCYLFVSAKSQPSLSATPTWIMTGVLAPFWSFLIYYLPIPMGPVTLFQHQKQDEEDYQRSFLSGLKMLYLSVALTFILAAANVYFFARAITQIPFFTSLRDFLMQQSLQLPHIFLSPQNFLDLNIPLGKKIASLLIQDLFFVLELFPTFGVAIAIGRLCGFRLPRMIYRPLQARSFLQYMGSFLYYYQQLIFKLFVHPLVRSKKFPIKSTRFRIFVALLIGGFLFHYMRDLVKISGAVNMFTFTFSYLQVLVYLVILSLLASFARPQKEISYHPAKIVLYYLIHPLVIISIMFVTRHRYQMLDFYNILLKALQL